MKKIKWILRTTITNLLSRMGYALLYCGDHEATKDYCANEYALKSHLIHIFKKNQINCVFDIGANKGQYARQLRELGYDGLIFSFEPTSHAYGSVSLF